MASQKKTSRDNPILAELASSFLRPDINSPAGQKAETAPAPVVSSPAQPPAETPAPQPSAVIDDRAPMPAAAITLAHPEPQVVAEPVDRNRPVRLLKQRAGRHPHPEPLVNMTWSITEALASRMNELAAYETLRLKRKVQASEVVRELLEDAISRVVNNQVFDDGTGTGVKVQGSN